VTTIREQLVDQIIDPDAAFNQPPGAMRTLQLRAAQELFEQRVEQIRLMRPASACSTRTAFARTGSSTILLATAAAIAGRA
jgi:hypothetical protein